MSSELSQVVSVIVPVYNVENYLNRCLDSLNRQSYRNLEIILVNDGATDASGEICEAYAAEDSRFRVLHQQNSGLSSARNTGLEAATAEFVTFIDSDDYVTEDCIEVLVNDLVETVSDIACRL